MTSPSQGPGCRPRRRLRRIAVALLCVMASAGIAAAQEGLSPLPPPVTRSQYRAQWFEFLSAFSENDVPDADRALEAMRRAGRKVGVFRLSDFSRTAVYLGHRAEKLGASERAGRAYAAALKLDESNPDAIVANLSFLLRQGRIPEALRQLPAAVAGFLSTREARVALLSSLSLWIALGIAGMLAGTILALGVLHLSRAWHDISERASRVLGSGGRSSVRPASAGSSAVRRHGPRLAPPVLGGAALSVHRGPRTARPRGRFRGPRAGPAASRQGDGCQHRGTLASLRGRTRPRGTPRGRERRGRPAAGGRGLPGGLGRLVPARRLRRALGRPGSSAVGLRPGNAGRRRRTTARCSNRGNVRFTEGDYGEAIRDYIEAGKRAPQTAAVFYNLSLARGEAYDFEGQAAAIRQAREISNSQVNFWADNPTLSRVVPAGYTLDRARERMAAWDAQPKSRRLPGHGSARGWRQYFPSWTFAPLAALGLGILLARRRDRDIAQLCDRCGRPFCKRCRRFGDPSLYCAACWKLYMKKDDVDIEVQVAETKAMQRRACGKASDGPDRVAASAGLPRLRLRAAHPGGRWCSCCSSRPSGPRFSTRGSSIPSRCRRSGPCARPWSRASRSPRRSGCVHSGEPGGVPSGS